MAAQKPVISSDTIEPRRRMIQNFHFLWLDTDIDQSNKDYQDKLAQLRCIVNDVNLFTQVDECIDFLTEVDDKKAFLLVEGPIGRRVVPLIHDISQLDTIYFLCRNNDQI